MALLKFLRFLKKNKNHESGATAIEYILIVMVVAIGLISGFQSFRGQVTKKFSNVGSTLISSGT